MRSVIVYVGGPRDGEEEPPEDGFPAPARIKTPAGDVYIHVQTYEVQMNDEVRHIYKHAGRP